MSDTTTPPPQFTSALHDPFDVANVDNYSQPGMFGVSPDVWRSLANFGGNLAAAANARTPGGFLQYGGGFAGPFGAAVSASQGQGLQRGVDLSHMALNRANAQSAQMDNYIKAMNLPLQIQQNKMILDMMQNPQAWAAKYGFGAPTLGGGQQNAGNGGSTDNWKPTFGGATNAPQAPQSYVPFYEEASKRTGIPVSVLEAQSAQESGYNPGATGAAGEIGIDQIKPDTARNPGYGLTGVQNPDVLRDPRTNINFGADYLKARAGTNVDWTDPNQVAAALRAYNGGGDSQYAQHVMRYIPATQQQTAQGTPTPQAPGAPSPKPYQIASNTPVAPPAPPAAPNGNGYANYPENNPAATGGKPAPQAQQSAPQPQASAPPGGIARPAANANEWMQKADQAEAQANQLENQRSQITVENARRAAFIKTLPPIMQMSASMNPNLQPLPMPPGDPAALRTEANTYRQQALQYQRDQSSPVTLRGQGSAAITPQGVIQSPLEYEIIGPDQRKYRITQNTVEDNSKPYIRPEGVPSWAPPGTLSIAQADLSPGEKKAAEESAEDAFGEKARSQYASAVGTTRAMEDLDHQFDQLNSQGASWYNTGAGAQWKLAAAKAVNAVAASSNLPPIFDEAKVASGEDIVKQSKLAGMQTLATFFGGSREAASIVHSTQSAVPNIENTPQGGKLVLNGIREGAQWVQDQHEFMANWSQTHAGNMVGADVAFNKQTPSQMYTRRAISMIKPFEISSDKELSRYLPGTFVSYKGNIVQVPERQGMPSIPEYMQGAHPYSMTQAPQVPTNG